jgi:LysR family positive regulator for ilvC
MRNGWPPCPVFGPRACGLCTAREDTVDFEDIKVFLSVARTLHFGRASRECNVSPSALSRAVKRMEDEVGCPLFVRDNRRVEPTPAGLRVEGWAREVLRDWEGVRRSLADGRGELSGELRLFSSVAASYTVLAGLFRGFRAAHPGVHIHLRTGDPAESVERVQSGVYDIAVAARPGSLPRSLAFKPVAVTPLEFVAPAAASEAYSLTSIRPIPWERVPMVLSETGLSRARADAWFRAAGIKPRLYAEVSGHEAILSMIRLGCGVGIVPRLVRERFSKRSEVRVLDVSPPLEPYIVGLCAGRRRLEEPVVRAFWDAAAEAPPDPD